uniref:Uncharacterized protein n=1 Tax=Amphimedon queenslandica TaxID=400682 RepID=A0A1X7U6T5_AMPQE
MSKSLSFLLLLNNILISFEHLIMTSSSSSSLIG